MFYERQSYMGSSIVSDLPCLGSVNIWIIQDGSSNFLCTVLDYDVYWVRIYSEFFMLVFLTWAFQWYYFIDTCRTVTSYSGINMTKRSMIYVAYI
jgi:hypothetical protein